MTLQPVNSAELVEEAADFYRQVMRVLRSAEVPFLVGGGYAFCSYTSICRQTKDFDLFVLPNDVQRALRCLTEAGYETENKYPHWLAKAYYNGHLVDIIFSSGNGICSVDTEWFSSGPSAGVLGESVQLVPVEEMIWQKAFIMERHRFDGSDVLQLFHYHVETINWDRLLRRFSGHWLVLFSHLLLYRYAYPDDRSENVDGVLQWLLLRLQKDLDNVDQSSREMQPLCRGTLLSLLDYLPAIENWGYRDARLRPQGNMTPSEVAHWTNTFER